MKRKPRSLFKARRRGPVLYAGPEFAGPEPRYLACVDELVRRFGHLMGSGRTEIQVLHDDDCAIFGGGACDCEPVARLVELEAPA